MESDLSEEFYILLRFHEFCRALAGPLCPKGALNSWRQGGKAAEAGHSPAGAPSNLPAAPNGEPSLLGGGILGAPQRFLLTSGSDCKKTPPKRRGLIAKESHMAPLGRHMVKR